jgi:hypothetical protein
MHEEPIVKARGVVARSLQGHLDGLAIGPYRAASVEGGRSALNGPSTFRR